MKKVLYIFLVLCLLALVVAGEQFYRINYNNLQSRDGEAHLVYVYPDTDLDSLLRTLDKDFTFASEWNFRFHARLMKFQHPKTGCYNVLSAGKTGDRQLIRMFQLAEQTPIRLSFNNIRTREQLAARLSQQLLLDSVEIITRLEDVDYMAKFGLNKETSVCLFIPNTYEVWWNISADKLFDRMQTEYQHFWTAERLKKANTLSLSPVEVATIASIVEEETNRDVDKPIIAGLYLNRLRIGMSLQSCPTIKFAWNDFTLRRILQKHLEIDSPYNTYKYPGLPPGPIRIPTGKTMDYVLNPTKSNYLFMCANKNLDGTHHFSATYAEHARYAREYQAEMDRRGI